MKIKKSCFINFHETGINKTALNCLLLIGKYEKSPNTRTFSGADYSVHRYGET